MTRLILPAFLAIVSLPALLPAQLVPVPAPAAAAAAAADPGLTNPWDFKRTMERLTQYGDRLGPMLEQIQPAKWKESSAGYDSQFEIVKTQLSSIRVITASLNRDPEQLPVILDLYFRYESFDLMLGSLLEGVRRYQNPAAADLITSLRNENAPARQGLKQYLVELASTREQEYRIVDQEAQRCRQQILKQPLPASQANRRPVNKDKPNDK